jgi:hypothetical protein
MGICRYCGKPAGVFRHVHSECEALHAGFRGKVRQVLDGVLVSNAPFDGVDIAIHAAASKSFVGADELKRIVAVQMAVEVDLLSNSRVLTTDDETRIKQACVALDIQTSDCSGVEDRMRKSSVLRGLEAGQLPKATISGYNPLQLQKDEQLIWVFNDCVLLEYHKSVSYVGRSGGISVRVAKGLYLHSGSSRGQRIEQENLERTAVGNLVVANKSISFVSSFKTLRVPTHSIVAINLFSDAIQISKGNAGSKPLVFQVDDPPFAANLVSHFTT